MTQRGSLFFDRIIVDLDLGQLVTLKPQQIRVNPIGELCRKVDIEFDFVSLIFVRPANVIILFIALLPERLFDIGQHDFAGFFTDDVVDNDFPISIFEGDSFASCFGIFDLFAQRIDNAKPLMLFDQPAGQRLAFQPHH